ncbi:aminotransferase class V-fold PLP-dependent enzyme [Pseudonocardia spinosispora]|uniref:aminotransferase class V-fold PLP-dependent enzyme n=1 Tax=Pseudonocardia spinosispora TaxID=103441 RepID=UPI00049169A0|nr:aminotransferase class V-fold PLP-dependent enzyme [Pseudonocardia spinosispora]
MLADAIRSRFPVFDNIVYLNSCSQGALSDSVRAAYLDYLEGLEREGSLWGHWVERLDQVRGALARLFGVTPGEVAVTTSESAGVAALASALDFDGTRNTVVTTSLEFPTIGQIWHAQERRGARVVHVEADPDSTIPLDRFADAIDDTTLIVSITQVCYRNGSVLDLAPIIELAHSRGALVLVDAYQGAGAIPLDVAALGADFVGGGCLKYLLGSPGVGYLVARADTTAGLVPTTTGWFGARDIFAMDIRSYDPAADARRFESGTPSVPSLYAAAAGVELMLEIGVAETHAHVQGLIGQLRGGIAELGGTVVTPESSRGPLLAVASVDEHEHVAALERDGVVVSSRDGNVRISPHCYNDDTDVEALLKALHTHRHLLRRP